MNKKNIKMLALVAFILVAGALVLTKTYSRYTSSSTGTSNAVRVAKWSIELNDVTIEDNATFTFNLFNTINDSDGKTEADVSSADTDVVIAPGTSGSFDIKLENLSEVSAKYGIDFSVTNSSNIPVEFSTDGSTWKSGIDDLDIAADDTNTKLAAKTGSVTKTVYWRWSIDGNNSTDTALGIGGTATLAVVAAVTATQID